MPLRTLECQYIPAARDEGHASLHPVQVKVGRLAENQPQNLGVQASRETGLHLRLCPLT